MILRIPSRSPRLPEITGFTNTISLLKRISARNLVAQNSMREREREREGMRTRRNYLMSRGNSSRLCSHILIQEIIFFQRTKTKQMFIIITWNFNLNPFLLQFNYRVKIICYYESKQQLLFVVTNITKIVFILIVIIFYTIRSRIVKNDTVKF